VDFPFIYYFLYMSRVCMHEVHNKHIYHTYLLVAHKTHHWTLNDFIGTNEVYMKNKKGQKKLLH